MRYIKSENPLKFASVTNIIYIHNLSVCFAICFEQCLASVCNWLTEKLKFASLS